MPSPFPGMDPYLEAPALWPDVHGSLILTIREQIQPLLSPRYTAVLTPYVAYESVDIATTRTMVPDIGIVERYDRNYASTEVAVAPAPLTGLLEVPMRYHRIEIRTVGDEYLVTIIEVLSPANKRDSLNGTETYDRQRRDILSSTIHLLEIDLLRAGRRPSLSTPLPPFPYFVLLSRAEDRPSVDIWPVSLREPVPVVAVPLQEGDADVPLDITQALHRIYASARYDLRIDYRAAPPPPSFSAEDAQWIDERLRAAGVR